MSAVLDGITRDPTGSDGNAPKRVERAQKNTRILIRRARDVGQIHIADYAGISDTTVSTWFSKNADSMGKALAYMELKLLPTTVACVHSQEQLDHLLYWAKIGMASMKSAEDLVFDDPE